MSGPWDRPSQDRESLASDQDAAPERPEAGQRPGETWPSSDLWPDQRPGSGSGWDDWSTLRDPDDVVLDEPASTLGDPWAESWAAEEAADRAPAPVPADEERWSEPQPERSEVPSPEASPEPGPAAWQPEAAAEREPAAWTPAPEADPWGSPAPLEAAATDPTAGAPHVAPWQSSDDPWGAVAEPEGAAAVEPSAIAEAAADDALSVEPGAVGPAAVEDALADAEAVDTTPTTGGWRRDLLPAWLTGRAASAAAEPEPEPEPAAVLEPGLQPAEAEPEVMETVPAEAEPEVMEPERAPAHVEAEPTAARLEPAPEPDLAMPAGPAALNEVEEAAPEAVAATPDAVLPEPEPFLPESESIVAAPEGDELPAASEFESAEPWTAGISAPMESVARAEEIPGDDGEGAAELEVPAATGTLSWLQHDASAAAASASLEAGDGDEDEADRIGDPRFHAWVDTPLIGAAAMARAADAPSAAPEDEAPEAPIGTTEAAVGADEPAFEDSLGAPESGLAPDVDIEPAIAGGDRGAAEPAPGTRPSSPQSDAWVAEPEYSKADADSFDAQGHEEPEGREDEADALPPRAAVAAAVVVAPDAEAGAEVRSGDSQPTWRPDWLPDLDESEAEGTRVLPVDWTVPPVSTPAADRSELAPQGAPARTRPTSDADRELNEEGEPGASTAEQAVPWLIGFILLLAGMVIVLLALIFAGDASLGGGSADPTPQPSLAAGMVGSPSPSPASSASAAASTTPQPSDGSSLSPEPTDAAVGGPQFGAIELVYQGRAAALAPIYLLHREFTTQPEPAVLAQDPNLDVRRYAWAMDGTLGAGLYTDLLVSIEPGVEKRQLAAGISTITFGPTPSTVYGVRITQDGANDVAAVLAVDFASGDASELARISYPRPTIGSETALREAQFEDDGGPVRLYWMEDNQLRLWVLGGGLWEIDPESGTATEPVRRLPILWSPDGRQHVVVSEDGGTSTLTRVDMDGNEHSSTTVEGLVSHLRWSAESERVVFTVGRSASGGGILQDLFLWDLGEDAPTQITATGAAFGAEWMGSRVRWREDPG